MAALTLLGCLLVACTPSGRAVDIPTGDLEYSIWSQTIVPDQPAAADGRSVEVGLRFTVLGIGELTGVSFYKSPTNKGPHVGRILSVSGEVLAEAAFADTDEGWQVVRFDVPVAVTPGEVLIASYLAPTGRYAADPGYFVGGQSVTNGALRADEGVYRYEATDSFASYEGTNYFVDPIFRTPAASATPSPTVTLSPPSSTSAPISQLKLRSVDGGLDYYAKFGNGLPQSPDFFPVGVWFEEVQTNEQAEKDKAAGINLYLELTTPSRLAVIKDAGMYAIPSWGAKDDPVAGTLLTDEADMWAGPGTGAWTGRYPGQGQICEPASAKCGYTVMQTQRNKVPAGRMTYANYGKGISFWESDADAVRFVNDYQDVLSVDNYWFTDPNICGAGEGGALVAAGRRSLSPSECRLAANYGRTMERTRSLVRPRLSKPVWAFVEVGHPFSEADAPTITGPEIRAAVWSSLIHGARGVVYFNHSFGGACVSQHVLREVCGEAVLPAVTATNAQIRKLAPVLNAPFLDGLVEASGGVDVAVKWYREEAWILAGSTSAKQHDGRLQFSCMSSGNAEVVDENRTVPITNGVLTDSFADGNAVHLYRVRGLDDSCDVPSSGS